MFPVYIACATRDIAVGDISMHNAGYIYAFATAVTWAVCAMFFTSASRRVGVFSMNHWRAAVGSAVAIAGIAILFNT